MYPNLMITMHISPRQTDGRTTYVALGSARMRSNRALQHKLFIQNPHSFELLRTSGDINSLSTRVKKVFDCNCTKSSRETCKFFVTMQLKEPSGHRWRHNRSLLHKHSCKFLPERHYVMFGSLALANLSVHRLSVV